MPATEQTWYDQNRLHLLFAISGTILFIATVWMLLADHNREWKVQQSQARNVLLTADRWKEEHLATAETEQKHAELQSALLTAQSQPIADELLQRFEQEVRDYWVIRYQFENPDASAESAPQPDFARVDKLHEELQALAATAAELRSKATTAQAELTQAETEAADALVKSTDAEKAAAAAGEAEKAAAQAAATAAKEASDIQSAAIAELRQAAAAASKAAMQAELKAGTVRQKLLDELNREFVAKVRFQENRLLGDRKFTNANLDKAKADEGLAVRDGRSPDVLNELEQKIKSLEGQVHALTLRYQAAADHRKALDSLVDKMTADEAGIQEKIEASRSNLVQLQKGIEKRRSTYVVWWGPGGLLPAPGKKWLEAPILSAFNSPLKIENLWSDDLTIDYNFQNVKRYDRCTTCHQMMEKSRPGQPGEAEYVLERHLTLVLTPPDPEKYAELKQAAADAKRELTVEEVFGLSLAADGLIDANAISVTHVVDASLAAQARLQWNPEWTAPKDGAAIRSSLLMTSTASQPRYALEEPNNPFAPSPGLFVGDVFVDVDGNVVRTLGEAQRFVLDGAASNRPVYIRVRRGLPNPYTSHPRLDLFVGSLSPHKMQEFGCTICHEGQGSATAFKWSGHTPDTLTQMKEWVRDYSWFDNHHWIYPMNANRFTEASCIKCHHEVVDLEPSERFPEPPAPKVVHGYNLIRKYGCYGCHEINGYDGAKRIGPDLRLEPMTFAAAQQLKADPSFEAGLSADEKDWVEALIQDPTRERERNLLFELLDGDDARERGLTETSYGLASLFKDIEAPGDLRKPGPSLRFSKEKLDLAFMYDWIANPQHFRPSTRMPRVFGLWQHLQNSEGLHAAEEFEPVEVLGISTYLLSSSQRFDYVEPPAEVTVAPSAERGKEQFQTRGCIACHSRGDFADAEAFRDPDTIVQGPDLTNIAAKFDPQRNPDGPKWLYSWIKHPQRYHVRTLMPDLFLDPIEVVVPDEEGAAAEAGGEAPKPKKILTDPVADIVAYLMAPGEEGVQPWEPIDPQPDHISAEEQAAIDELLLQYLTDAFSIRTAEVYVKTGIPASRASELKSLEQELLVEPGQQLTEAQKLNYIGRKSIAKYGCYGCHDIPGFEDAKPSGTSLNDWGRKEPAKLAFEHIVQYIEHGHHGGHAAETAEAGHAAQEHAPSPAQQSGVGVPAGPADPLPDYFEHQILSGNRIGFLYQKLREPRSYDFLKTENKKYNERLRMPQFPFNEQEREAVMTFVLGLVADPPAPKYVYQPNERRQAIIQGEKVLEKYNCQSCHILNMDQYTLAFPPEYFGQQMSEDDKLTIFPFLLPHVLPEMRKASETANRRGLHQSEISVMPRISNDGKPYLTDDEGDELDPESEYDPTKVLLYLDLWDNTVLSGHSYMMGSNSLIAPRTMVAGHRAASGGFLTRYLLPVVTQIEANTSGGDTKGQEAMAWLPPPLIGEGRKVQSDWLHQFLLEPYKIRPAVYLRMPKFNMSPEEATKLAAYFAAVDHAEYPYTFSQRQRSTYLEREEASYQDRLQRMAQDAAGEAAPRSRFDDAMKIVVSNDYCVKCHIVGDFVPTSSPQAMGPDLADVYRRLRPGYVRDWIANPKTKLPYTAMPVNIPFNADAPHLGGVDQEKYYHGTSIEQLDALVDLLMNFDVYSLGKTRVADQVPAPGQATEAAPATEPTSADEPASEATATTPNE
jgi:cytochrome c2